MLQKTLRELGLSPSEITVYLHLLTGSSYATKLSSETGINRTNVYEALDRLVEKGIASFVQKNNVKWFAAKPLSTLMNVLDSQQSHLDHVRKNLLQDIESYKQPTPEHQLEATIFVGKKGLRMLFDEILSMGKPVSLIAAELQFKQYFGPYFELWHRERAKKRIRQRSIFPENLRNVVRNRPLLRYKFIPDEFTNPTTTIIYGDNTLLIQWSREPVAVKISNKEITKSHLNHFNLMWKRE